jgi:hypothetical protein
MPKVECLHLHTVPTVPVSRCSHRKLWVYSPPARDLWWDDASYIRYQSHDPYADYDPLEGRYVATIYTGDYCGSHITHYETCPKPRLTPKAAWDDPPF